jgi:hypothetical protein
MKRLSIFTLVVILISITGAVTLWLNHNQTALAGSGGKDVSTKQQPSSQDIHFTPKGAIDGLVDEKFRYSSETYESTDGVGVFVSRQYCSTAENAERALTERLKKATKIIEQNILLDEEGKPIGRRIVAVFDYSEESEQTPSILWTDDDMFYVIDSSSFQHSLLLEKDFFHNKVGPGLSAY